MQYLFYKNATNCKDSSTNNGGVDTLTQKARIARISPIAKGPFPINRVNRWTAHLTLSRHLHLAPSFHLHAGFTEESNPNAWISFGVPMPCYHHSRASKRNWLSTELRQKKNISSLDTSCKGRWQAQKPSQQEARRLSLSNRGRWGKRDKNKRQQDFKRNSGPQLSPAQVIVWQVNDKRIWRHRSSDVLSVQVEI
jgi:hypothetical protein